jgi:hypothetical protein
MARRMIFRKGALGAPKPVAMMLTKQTNTRNGPVTHFCYMDPVYSDPVFTERELMVLAGFRQEMRACDERACECTCHCHAGVGICYGDTDETSKNTETRFHQRVPNTAHKRAHRECPKEGREHNKR